MLVYFEDRAQKIRGGWDIGCEEHKDDCDICGLIHLQERVTIRLMAKLMVAQVPGGPEVL